jgi:hypothetical protein
MKLPLVTLREVIKEEKGMAFLFNRSEGASGGFPSGRVSREHSPDGGAEFS